jgi:hypothetical protein
MILIRKARTEIAINIDISVRFALIALLSFKKCNSRFITKSSDFDSDTIRANTLFSIN